MREVTWFGRPYEASLYRDLNQVPCPAGCACMYCDEAILIGDDGFLDSTSNPFHRECWFRMFVGSVAHQRHLCGCYVHESVAVTEESEGLTPREGAKRAVAYYLGIIDG